MLRQIAFSWNENSVEFIPHRGIQAIGVPIFARLTTHITKGLP
jgi:heme oxygenase